VAAVAIHAVVDIAADAPMFVICLRLRVTDRALKNGVVVWIGMAGRAHSIRSAMVHGEVGVIEGGVEPVRSRMAGRATGGETR